MNRIFFIFGAYLSVQDCYKPESKKQERFQGFVKSLVTDSCRRNGKSQNKNAFQ